jgi:hypothetical protein
MTTHQVAPPAAHGKKRKKLGVIRARIALEEMTALT